MAESITCPVCGEANPTPEEQIPNTVLETRFGTFIRRDAWCPHCHSRYRVKDVMNLVNRQFDVLYVGSRFRNGTEANAIQPVKNTLQ